MRRNVRIEGVVAFVALALSWAIPLGAQDEATLKRAFEGKRVTLRIDMPATHQGVNVRPGRDLPVDFSEVADRIKDYGIAIRAGDEQMITKVHIVRHHIEFQLGGGGYGTFSDMLTSPYQAPPIPQGETAEEARIRAEIATTTDNGVRRSLERRLGELQRQRQADYAAAERQATELNRAAQSDERERRLESGSRFNIRYDGSIPAEGLTPEGVMAALSEYVDFSAMAGTATPEPATGPGAGAIALRKGMTTEEVEALLGPAESVDRETAAGIEVVTRTYEHPEHKVVARFAGGVLVDYAITPH